MLVVAICFFFLLKLCSSALFVGLAVSSDFRWRSYYILEPVEVIFGSDNDADQASEKLSTVGAVL